MANTIATAYINLLPTIDGGAIKKSASSIGSSLKSALTGGALLAGATKIAGKMKDAAMSAASYADDMMVTAQQTGLSTKFVQQFTNAAELTDVEFNSIKRAANQLTKQLSNKTGVEMMKQLGIATKDANGNVLDQETLFKNAMTGISGLENATERAQAAQQLFGTKGAQNMMPLINNYEQLSKSIEGTEIMSDEELTKAGEADDAYQKMEMSLQKMSLTVGQAFLPVMQQLTNTITKIITPITNFIKNNQLLVPVLSGMAIVIGTIIGALKIWSAVQKVLNVVLAANPIVLIVLAVITLIGVIILLIKNWEKVKAVAVKVWASILNAVKSAWNWIKGIAGKIASPFINAFNNIKNKCISIFNTIKSAIGNAFKAAINFALSGIESYINSPIRAINSLLGVINKIPGVNIPTIPTISLPRLAKGGIATSPTLAEIGEAGAEAVIPLDRLGDMVGAGNITVKIDDITLKDSDGTFLAKLKNINKEQIFINNVKAGLV